MAKRGAVYQQALTFPLGGLHKARGYTDQPPNTSPDLLNVRGFGTAEGRARGGQRAGLGKTYAEQLGSGNPVRFLGQVTTLQKTGTAANTFVESDEFSGEDLPSLGAGWSAASWEADGTLYRKYSGYATIDGQSENCGNVRDALGYLTTSAYTVRIQFLNDQGNTGTVKYRLYARMDDTTPVVTTEGVVVELIVAYNAGTGARDYSGTLKEYNAGTPTSYDLATGTFTGELGWLKLAVSANTCVVTLNTTQLLSQAVTAQTGKRVGLGGQNDATTQYMVVGWDVLGVTDTSGDQFARRTYLVATSNGVVSAETNPGAMATVSGNQALLSSDHLIVGFERAQKLYIADYGGAKAYYTDGVFAANGVDLSSASIADWTARSINVNNDVVVVSAGTSNVVNGVYKISAVIAAKLTTTATVGGSGNCTFRIEKAPKVYDPATNAMDYWYGTAANAVPCGCPCGCLYRDRAVLAGQETAPHVWYMSRQGNMLDWDYSQIDSQRAVAGTSTDAGTIGDMITAVIPWSDDILVFGAHRSIWICRGDPAYGGFIDVGSYEAGVLDKRAWCFDPDGNIFFMDRKGLYMLQTGAAGRPVPVSREVLPEDLRGINTNSYDVLLSWDHEIDGVHIYVTPVSSGTAYHYFWDARLKSFWKDSHVAAQGPTALVDYRSSSSTTNKLILGGRDGYLRSYGSNLKSDDGTAIASHVLFTPQFLGGAPDREGIWLELDVALAEDTDACNYDVLVGDTVEEAVGASAFESGTWTTGGAQKRIYPRARGVAGILKLGNSTAGQTWMVESAMATFRQSGRLRMP